MNIHPHGYWLDGDTSGHRFDAGLALALVPLFRGSTVVDLGCGPGWYVGFLAAHDIDARGYDGNPWTPMQGGARCHVHNLTQPLDAPADWVLCLEVIEHVPPEHEAAVLENIRHNARQGIVLSWAPPGQAGTGHVNCRQESYVREQFAEYQVDAVWGDDLRAGADLEWFKRNVAVFRKVS